MFIKEWCIAYRDGTEYGKLFFERKNLIYSMNPYVEVKNIFVTKSDCL